MYLIRIHQRPMTNVLIVVFVSHMWISGRSIYAIVYSSHVIELFWVSALWSYMPRISQFCFWVSQLFKFFTQDFLLPNRQYKRCCLEGMQYTTITKYQFLYSAEKPWENWNISTNCVLQSALLSWTENKWSVISHLNLSRPSLNDIRNTALLNNSIVGIIP